MVRESDGKAAGVCRVCKGTVVETMVTRAEDGPFSRSLVIGGPANANFC